MGGAVGDSPDSSSQPRPVVFAALMSTLDQKGKMLELELTKERVICTKDKEGLVLAKRVMEEQLAEHGKNLGQHQLARQLAEQQLQKVQGLCLMLDKDKLHEGLLKAFESSLLSHELQRLNGLSISLYSLTPDYFLNLRRMCEQLPDFMIKKVEEVIRGVRLGIERVAHENAELQRQKAALEHTLKTSQEAQEKAEKEAQAREAKLQSETQRQMQLALEEKAALRKGREELLKELEQRKREVEQLRLQWDVTKNSLDTCIRAKVGCRREPGGCSWVSRLGGRGWAGGCVLKPMVTPAAACQEWACMGSWCGKAP